MMGRQSHKAAFVLLLVLFGGCGTNGPQVAPVHGRITLDGQPLALADILFQPEGGQRPSTGRADADGRYELVYKRGQEGALVGTHSVHISVSGEMVKNPPVIAAKFNTQSELRCEVKPGPNEFNFDVSAEKK